MILVVYKIFKADFFLMVVFWAPLEHMNFTGLYWIFTGISLFSQDTGKFPLFQSGLRG